MNKIIAVLVVSIVIGGGAYYYSTLQTAPAMEASKTGEVTAPTGSMVREFNVTGTSFKFDPAMITVKKGETVKINFTNAQGFHDWVIDEFNARTQKLAAGKSETISFVADKVGAFEYYCSVGDHRKEGMVGTLTVTE